MKLGEVIRTYRKRRGWTQGQLALHAGLGAEHISMIERGIRENPTIESVAKIAVAIEASVDAILIEACLLPLPENDEPWSPALIAMQRFLNQIPPEHRDTFERVIQAQWAAWKALHPEDDNNETL